MLLTSYGWIECVGCADRSAYDLTVHSKKVGGPLIVREPRLEPSRIEEWQVDINKAKFGPAFRKDTKLVEAALKALEQTQREELSEVLKENGHITIQVPGILSDDKIYVSEELVSFEKRTTVQNTRDYTPNVIEPSFGIGRILYSLLEHVYWSRPDDFARGVWWNRTFLIRLYANLDLGFVPSSFRCANQSTDRAFVKSTNFYPGYSKSITASATIWNFVPC